MRSRRGLIDFEHIHFPVNESVTELAIKDTIPERNVVIGDTSVGLYSFRNCTFYFFAVALIAQLVVLVKLSRRVRNNE